MRGMGGRGAREALPNTHPVADFCPRAILPLRVAHLRWGCGIEKGDNSGDQWRREHSGRIDGQCGNGQHDKGRGYLHLEEQGAAARKGQRCCGMGSTVEMPLR